MEYTQTSFSTIDSTQTTSTSEQFITLTDLEEYTEYIIRVRANTNAGSGPYSNATNSTTLEDSKYKAFVSNYFRNSNMLYT